MGVAVHQAPPMLEHTLVDLLSDTRSRAQVAPQLAELIPLTRDIALFSLACSRCAVITIYRSPWDPRSSSSPTRAVPYLIFSLVRRPGLPRPLRIPCGHRVHSGCSMRGVGPGDRTLVPGGNVGGTTGQLASHCCPYDGGPTRAHTGGEPTGQFHHAFVSGRRFPQQVPCRDSGRRNNEDRRLEDGVGGAMLYWSHH